MSTDFANLSCQDFVDVLASAAPVPGGGGASALAGALGMALGNMVGALTVGKPKYASVEADIIALQAQATALQDRLLQLIATDAAAFEPLAQAYRLPTDTEEQRAHKAAVMEDCLRAACAPPLAIMEACAQAIELHEQFAAKGTPLALSDVGVGVRFCQAALQGASLNVFINTAAMTDRAWAEATEARANQLLAESGNMADNIFNDVSRRIRGQ